VWRRCTDCPKQDVANSALEVTFTPYDLQPHMTSAVCDLYVRRRCTDCPKLDVANSALGVTSAPFDL
jgi:hypothetical protein